MEIAEWIFSNFQAECLAKKQRSKAQVSSMQTDEQLIDQLAAEMSRVRKKLQGDSLNIKVTPERPMRYYYDPNAKDDLVPSIHNQVNTLDVNKESSLYPILRHYLYKEHQIHSIRINHERSEKTRGAGINKWLHPDIVGIKDLSTNWSTEISECVTLYGDRKSQLWSFEVKLLINLNNVRESYFQALSNSSWANLGYLVTATIDDDAIEELRILYGRHGIGVLLLDETNPADSKIIIPAKEHDDIDWNTANRLCSQNPDFRNFTGLIKHQGISESISLFHHLNNTYTD